MRIKIRGLTIQEIKNNYEIKNRRIRRKWFTLDLLKYTDTPRVLLRSELYMPLIDGIPVGCTWAIDIDGYRFHKLNAPNEKHNHSCML